jgi:hypothetical protein
MSSRTSQFGPLRRKAANFAKLPELLRRTRQGVLSRGSEEPSKAAGVLIVVLCLGALSLAATALAGPSVNGSGVRPESAPPSSKNLPCSSSRFRPCASWRPFWSATTT